MNPFRKIRDFYSETMTELHKTVWPKRDELRDMTFVVVVATLIFAAFVFLADFSIFNIVELFTSLVSR